MQQFDKVTAIFSPTKVDDLVEGMDTFIGKSGEFTAAYILENGVYEGQFAMQTPICWPCAWVPEADLKI